MIEYFTYPSPIGLLLFQINDNKISSIQFTDKEKETPEIDHQLIAEITHQWDAYFNGELFQFNLPLEPEGTAFQKKVWKQLQQIDYGEQISYAELALQLGDKNLVRAVGGANSKNPLAIIVPCHRVIGANNRLVGYAGGLWRKKWLLLHEIKYRKTSTQLF